MKRTHFGTITTRFVLLVLCQLGIARGGMASDITITDADMSGDTVWTADNTYILEGLVFVEDGESLTIEAGTVVKGKPGQGADASALIVARGGKIFALGAANAPIIFTAEADDVNDPSDLGATDRGLWGGLIVLGRATINSPQVAGQPVNEDQIEGIPETETRGAFGGDDDDDSSGVIRFVSIRHGGTNIGADNEINGLTLGAVGRGTTIKYVEVFANADDGVEFFGGTVNTKYLAVVFCADDSFDYDQGFRGKGQFWFTIEDEEGDNGGEHDGDVDDKTRLPLAIPEIYNATFIGTGSDLGGSQKAFLIRDNAGAKYYNSIFTEYPGIGIRIDDNSQDRLAAGDIDFRNNIWFNFGAGATPAALGSGTDTPSLFEDADRMNEIVDPELVGISYFEDGGLDPRPGLGSPANEGAREVPADGFFTPVTHRGAFDSNDLWLVGWTALDALGFVGDNATDVVEITDADIDGDVVFLRENTYLLDGFVFVEDGESLTIEAGTVIQGKPGQGANASALIVARGGKIFANGTPTNPIIFTAEGDDLSDPFDLTAFDRGLWGGMIVLGRSTINSPEVEGVSPNVDQIEGLPDTETRGRFGGNDEDDSSGVLRYVSIRHGGTNIGADNEINGLTLGAVGRGTVVEFIEVISNADDGIEFFGGTVDTRYLLVSFCGDDSFDYDQGFRGRGQFWFTLEDEEGDNGGEHDGDIDDKTRLPLALPEIHNATFIGGGQDVGGSQKAFLIRDNAGAKYYNSIFTDYPGIGVRVDDNSQDRILAGDIDFRNNIWFGFGAGDTSAALASGTNTAILFDEADRLNQIVDPGILGISRFEDRGLDPRPASDGPAFENIRPVPEDDFFVPAGFRGAFGTVNWAADWSALSEYEILTNRGAGSPVRRPAGTPEPGRQLVLTVGLAGGSVNIGFVSEVGVSYQLQSREDVNDAWEDDGEPMVGTGEPISFSAETDRPVEIFRVITR